MKAYIFDYLQVPSKFSTLSVNCFLNYLEMYMWKVIKFIGNLFKAGARYGFPVTMKDPDNDPFAHVTCPDDTTSCTCKNCYEAAP